MTTFAFGEEEFIVAHIRNKLTHIYKTVDMPLDIGDGWLIGRKPPLIVHCKLKAMLVLLQIMNICKIIARLVYRYLSLPIIEGAGEEDISITMFPGKYGRHIVFCEKYLLHRHDEGLNHL